MFPNLSSFFFFLRKFSYFFIYQRIENSHYKICLHYIGYYQSSLIIKKSGPALDRCFVLLLEYPHKCLREMHGPCEMICTIGNDKALDKSYKSDGLAVRDQLVDLLCFDRCFPQLIRQYGYSRFTKNRDPKFKSVL